MIYVAKNFQRRFSQSELQNRMLYYQQRISHFMRDLISTPLAWLI